MIRAIDTNVAVRLPTNDDPARARAAWRLVEEEFVVTAAMLVEAEWVLRSSYEWTREICSAGLRLLLSLSTMVQAPKGTHWAIDGLEAGADFADMMHLATAGPVDAFATFDRRLAKRAGADAPLAIETPA